MGIRSRNHGRPCFTVRAGGFAFALHSNRSNGLLLVRQTASSSAAARFIAGLAFDGNAFRRAAVKHDPAPRVRRQLAVATGRSTSSVRRPASSNRRADAPSPKRGCGRGALHRRTFRRCFIAYRRSASGVVSCSRCFASFRHLHTARIVTSTLHDMLPMNCRFASRSSTDRLSATRFTGSERSTSPRSHVASSRLRPSARPVGSLLQRAFAIDAVLHAGRALTGTRPARSPRRTSVRTHSATQHAGQAGFCARPNAPFRPVAVSS